MIKKMDQKGLAPILIVILIALTVGGYLVYQKQAKPNPVPASSSTPRAIIQPSPPTADETANWKIYTSETLGFSLQYPGNWNVEGPTKEDSGVYIKSSEWIGEGVEPIQYYIFFNEHKNPDNLPLQKLLKKEFGDAYIANDDEFVKEQIGEYVVFKVENVQPSLAGTFDVFIADKKQTRYISLTFSPYSSKESYEDQAKYFQIFNQILSTFKFQ